MSMKAPYDLPTRYDWQNKVVVITEQEEILSGDYDGYGRVGYEEINSDAPECWHKECYEVHGEPKRYTGPSEYSYDQGYFYDRD